MSNSLIILPTRPMNTFGITKDQTKQFFEFKLAKRRRERRFEPKATFINEKFDKKSPLLDETATSDMEDHLDVINLNEETIRKPTWEIIYEETNATLKEVDELYYQFQRLKEQRMKLVFKSKNHLDSDIAKLCENVSNKLQKCNANVNKITASMDCPEQMKKNIKNGLLQRINELSQRFRTGEKRLLEFLYQGTGRDEIIAESKTKKLMIQTLSREEVNDRDDQIDEILNSLKKLSTIFLQMDALVSEQGTVLDRIDYNLSNQVVHVKEATKQLNNVVTITTQKGIFAKCRNFLVVSIAFATLLLVVKFSHH